jgi:hypothetical protein
VSQGVKMKFYKISEINQIIDLWLDDERNPSNQNTKSLFGSIGSEIWVKTPQEAIDFLSQGNVRSISFDYDLGGDLTGITVANWIEEQAYNGKIKPLTWKIHSANPVGRQDISRAMNSAERFWGCNK